ncbi:Cold shock protein 1 [Striga hermonthica]|uniref:Cold shock protein 1 n=1 Tax=Striga hermonthica TaxID=68872 RepID=A0A9N7N016_STRHE|nr:Cold shock protein 1 [Striga hermonthica]
MAEENLTRSKGVVSKFNDQKGYGFIKPDEGGEDLFVHQTAIKSDGYRTLREGQVVEFTIILDGDKTKATDVTAPGGGPVDLTPRKGNNSNSRGGAVYGSCDRRNDGNGFGYRSGGGGECFTCGQYGHLSRDCTGGGGGGTCYNCGGYGHRARECPSGSRSSGGGNCYSCGEAGHLARDCMGSGGGAGMGGYSRGGGGFGRFGGGGGNCFNCGESGHFARECKEPHRP